MKKLITLSLMLLILFSGSHSASAAVTKEVVSSIKKVYYMADAGYYVAETVKDKDGGFWIVQVSNIAIDKENAHLTRLFKKQYEGKKVHIVLSGNEQQDEEVEIIDSWIE